MRWDKLFAELEAQVLDDEALERDLLVDELVEGDWAETCWFDLVGGQVELEVIGLGAVSGVVERTSDELIHLNGSSGQWLIDRSAVVLLLGATARRTAPGEVGAQLGWRHVLRQLRGEEVSLARRDGTVMHGSVDVVGRDFVRLETAPGRTVDLPLAWLAGLRSR